MDHDIPPFALARDRVWRLDPAHVAAWRAWAGEVVVYDDRSGDTLKLDVIAAEAFRLLSLGPVRQEDVVGHIAGVLDLEADPRLYRLTEIALERLAASNLAIAEPIAQPAPPVR